MKDWPSEKGKERRRIMKYRIIRSEKEIEKVLDQAEEGFNEGTRFPSMSAEEGIQDFFSWLVGNSDDPPLEY